MSTTTASTYDLVRDFAAEHSVSEEFAALLFNDAQALAYARKDAMKYAAHVADVAERVKDALEAGYRHQSFETQSVRALQDALLTMNTLADRLGSLAYALSGDADASQAFVGAVAGDAD